MNKKQAKPDTILCKCCNGRGEYEVGTHYRFDVLCTCCGGSGRIELDTPFGRMLKQRWSKSDE